jgi:hypothetical protein
VPPVLNFETKLRPLCFLPENGAENLVSGSDVQFLSVKLSIYFLKAKPVVTLPYVK